MYIYDTNKYCNMNKILEGPFTIEEDVKKSLNIECVKIINGKDNFDSILR